MIDSLLDNLPGDKNRPMNQDSLEKHCSVLTCPHTQPQLKLDMAFRGACDLLLSGG